MRSDAPPDPRLHPIGVFDSGVGGLTVFRALRHALPGEGLLYLGDTARVPYGTKSAESVTRYAHRAASFLVERGIKLLVVACNTASAIAIDSLRAAFAPLPVVGVIDPGAEAGARASRRGRIAVIATEATVRSGVYQRAILAARPGAQVTAAPCSLFVALAEEGWTDGPVVRAVAEHYLRPVFTGTGVDAPDTLVLGCTHFPVLIAAIRSALDPSVAVVDSALTTATHVAGLLAARSLASPAPHAAPTHFMATDGVERFGAVGRVFLGEAIAPEAVELVDL
jgi:glutamate racemase